MKNRGELFMYKVDDLIEVYLGEKENPESNFILSLHKLYIKDLIAVLRLYEDSE